MQEGITVEALLDSGATGLVISSKFAKKQGFKLKKLERPMNVRNVDGSLNKEEPIENTVKINIYYQGHRKRMEIDTIRGQKWTVILGMPWLACYNSEIDWRTGEVKMTRCLEECGKQWRPVVKHGSHQGGSLQNGLGDEWTCGTTLASAYVLRHLSAAWSQLQMKEGKSKWK